jgi:hypothetical protein
MIQETYDIMTHIRHPLQRLNKAIKKVLVPSRRRTIGTLSKVPWLVSSSTFPLPAKSPTLGILELIVERIERVEYLTQSHSQVTEDQIHGIVDSSLREIFPKLLEDMFHAWASRTSTPVVVRRTKFRIDKTKILNKNYFIPVLGLNRRDSGILQRDVGDEVARGYHSYLGLNRVLLSAKVSNKILLSEDILKSDTSESRNILGMIDKFFRGDIVYFSGGLKGAKAQLVIQLALQAK